MDKYIDADKLEKDGWSMQRIRQVSSTEMVYETKKPTDFPAADVAEVQYGKWDDSKVAFHRVCSRCHAVIRQDVSLVYLLECMEKVGALNYCPNCGAKMQTKEEG